MKITEKRIKQIILEEIQNFSEQEEKEGGEEEKMAGDVEMVTKQMPRIDNYKEYEQMLMYVINHNFGDEQRKKIILRKAYMVLNKMLTGK